MIAVPVLGDAAAVALARIGSVWDTDRCAAHRLHMSERAALPEPERVALDRHVAALTLGGWGELAIAEAVGDAQSALAAKFERVRATEPAQTLHSILRLFAAEQLRREALGSPLNDAQQLAIFKMLFNDDLMALARDRVRQEVMGGAH